MARPIIQDVLQNMRFHVSVSTQGRGNRLGLPDAGFNNISTPEVTLDAVDYREGHNLYTRKFPGIPTMGTCTMSRGVTRPDTSFYDWMRETIEGTSEYRVDLEILHFHREANPGGPNFPVEGLIFQNKQIDVESTPAKKYALYDCFPTRHKVAADLDATSAEVSVMELEVVYESFDVIAT